MDRYYLSSVDRRWKKELARAKSRVVICSPYLTPKTAEAVICSADRGLCEVYTRFSVMDFAFGASSLRTIRLLREREYSVYELEGLHAKLVLVSGAFVSVGSQNLTSRGVTNREATATSTDPDSESRPD
jgi:phosphatidylserine/phosphatidylglycerophosphate/cardiolipin synthase-like enzyme